MGAIRILPVHLVNKIAAGEVIERPASVVKELIENAVDAGATRIDVTVHEGGRALIAVADNGGGMTADDLALAFSPHATSKLADEDALFDIRTMGFRGEALASVASISHAHVRTRRADEDGGHELQASGDEVGEVRPCAAAPGTTITIRDLFFNTPARRKFMRTASTEMGHITEQLSRLALPHPQVAFTLTHNKRVTLKLPAVDTTSQRIRDLFGEAVADGLLSISAGRDGLDVSGLIGPPSSARGSGKWQYVFVNGRYIRDRLLSHALREAYRGLVDPNRWPVAFLFLQVEPGRIDVNVHPTKIEVRFADSQQVHSLLLGALRDGLNKTALAPAAQLADRLSQPPDAGPPDPDPERQQSLRQALADFLKSTPKPQPRLSFPPESPAEPDLPSLTPTSSPAPAPAASATPAPAYELAPPPTSARPDQIMQVHNCYLVVAESDGLVIVDQHALHERILYNELTQRLTQQPLASQRLLIPQTLTLTPAEADTLAQAEPTLKNLGVVVEPFGPNTVAVQQFPTLLSERGVEPQQFLRDAIDTLTEDDTADGERLMESLLQLMACKAAVKAGDPLTTAEARDLLARRHELDKAPSCPHGRPTTLTLSLADLERQFKRT